MFKMRVEFVWREKILSKPIEKDEASKSCNFS